MNEYGIYIRAAWNQAKSRMQLGQACLMEKINILKHLQFH